LKEAFEAKISEAYTIAVKQDRYAALDALYAEAVAQFVPEEDEMASLMKLTNYSKILNTVPYVTTSCLVSHVLMVVTPKQFVVSTFKWVY
jgi:polyribonucleotide nucleotidyltransferase